MNTSQTAFEVLAQINDLRPIMGGTLWKGPKGKFVMTSYGFEPFEKVNLQIENKKLKSEIAELKIECDSLSEDKYKYAKLCQEIIGKKSKSKIKEILKSSKSPEEKLKEIEDYITN